jgi:hypothetical protein
VVKVVSTWGNRKAISGGMGRVFRLKCVVVVRRRRRPYLLSSHVSSLVTSQHFNGCRGRNYLTSSSVRRLSSVPIEFPRHRSKIWHRSTWELLLSSHVRLLGRYIIKNNSNLRLA